MLEEYAVGERASFNALRRKTTKHIIEKDDANAQKPGTLTHSQAAM